MDRKGHCTPHSTASSYTWDCECSPVPSCSWWQVLPHSLKLWDTVLLKYIGRYIFLKRSIPDNYLAVVISQTALSTDNLFSFFRVCWTFLAFWT